MKCAKILNWLGESGGVSGWGAMSVFERELKAATRAYALKETHRG